MTEAKRQQPPSELDEESWLDRPVVGPMSARQVARGLRDALIVPIANDEQALYMARHANPAADVAASLHPAYGVPAALQDIAHGGNVVTEGAGAFPVIKGLRAAYKAAEALARQGSKGKRAARNVLAGTASVTGVNAANRTEEFKNPGPMPDQYK